MHLNSKQELLDLEQVFDDLWPICRSLTGDGVRESLDIIEKWMPLQRTSVKSGTQVYDWTVPKEWNINDAYIITPEGEKIAQFKENNLHVMNYSVPVNKKVSFSELKEHLYTLKNQPDAIPYVTSYYKEKWGFCISENQLSKLSKEGEYEVFIDSTLADGELIYAEGVLKGSSEKEVLISTYICHPSMANNELSGPLAALFLYRRLLQTPNRRLTYRFLFAPETIGVIAFLSKSGEALKKNLEAGYVLTCCGDRGDLTFKESKQVNSKADEMAKHILEVNNKKYSVVPFAVGGSDERQYCSPGFNLPVGSLMRTPYQKYKEYHTSLDNKEFLSFEHLQEVIDCYEMICTGLDMNVAYKGVVQHCEPQLGKRGLYPDSAQPEDSRILLHRLLHLLSYADGQTDLLTIAKLRNESILDFQETLRKCLDADTLTA